MGYGNENRYQKPAVRTVDIPERTAYACNFSRGNNCPSSSNISSPIVCNPGMGNAILNGQHGGLCP